MRCAIMVEPRRIAVIGAGLAGVSAALALADQGHIPVLFEKSRGPGGRCATRRGPEGSFDHGAQYFTARDPRFRRWVEHWLDAGLVARYSPRMAHIDEHGVHPASTGTDRFVAVPGMSALVKALAHGLDVRAQTRVAALHFDGAWQVSTESGDVHRPFDAVALALPCAQAAALDHHFAPALAAMQMSPCWAAMLSFAQPLPTAFDAAFVNSGPLSWIARDSAKPGRSPGERWVVHVSPATSQLWLEELPATVQVRILDAFFAALNMAPVEPSGVDVHRWRYALAVDPVHDGCWFDAGRRLAVGGDWCAGSRIEGAFLSGQAIAGRLLQSFATDVAA